MTARVKETGAIVEVEFIERKTHTGEQVYMTHEGYLIEESRLDFNVEPDYWTRLEHQYAGMIVQGMVEHNGINFLNDAILNVAVQKAHALVEKLKEKEERK